MNLFNELLMHVHELYMNMHERSSSDELHFSGVPHEMKWLSASWRSTETT